MNKPNQPQVQDRHEHGGLPDAVQIKTLGTRGLIEGWEFWPSATGALADITVDEHGHVTVTCHCARCEAERERESLLKIISVPYDAGPDGALLIYGTDGQVTKWYCPRCGAGLETREDNARED